MQTIISIIFQKKKKNGSQSLQLLTDMVFSCHIQSYVGKQLARKIDCWLFIMLSIKFPENLQVYAW